MTRFFNTAGPCRPDLYYMMDPLPRLSGVKKRIEGLHYFVEDRIYRKELEKDGKEISLLGM